MNKQDLVAHFIKQLEQDLAAGKESARASREAATDEESKPENQYDTRALEASYLAGAQAHRVVQINEVLVLLQTIKFRDFASTEPVQVGAFVRLEANGKVTQALVLPKGGGVSLKYEGQAVQILTSASSLGEAIMGLRAGEIAEFEVGDQLRSCKILEVK